MEEHWFTQAHGLELAEFDRRIAAVCRSIPGADVDDVKQEIYFQLLKLHQADPNKFPGQEDVLKYAATSARYLIWHETKAQKRREGAGPDIDLNTLAAPAENTDDAARNRLLALLADCARAAEILTRCSDQVSEVYFRLCSKEKREDVAAALAISCSTVYRINKEALAFLKSELESDKDTWGLE